MFKTSVGQDNDQGNNCEIKEIKVSDGDQIEAAGNKAETLILDLLS